MLSQALQQRRSQLDRMLVVPPQHMEYVDNYVHRGWVDPDKERSDYDRPWEWLKRNQGIYDGYKLRDS